MIKESAIMLPKPRVALLSAIPILLAALAYLTQSHATAVPTATKQAGGVTVAVVKAEERDLPIIVQAVGTMAASNSVLVRARIDGLLQTVAFTEGSMVKAGQLLARIDATPYEAQLREAIARRKVATARHAHAEEDLTRYKNLVDSGFASAEILAQKRTKVAEEKASAEAGQAQIDAARSQLDNTVIRAPITGRVGGRLIDTGNLVRSADGTPIVSIVQTHPMAANFAMPMRLLPEILEAKQSRALTVTMALPGSDHVIATGQLSFVNNEIDQNTAQIHLKATFANDKDMFWPGQFVSLKLHLGVRHHAIVIPPAAIQSGPDGNYVYIVRPDQTVTRRTVLLASKDSSAAVIEKGVQAHDVVVVDGQQKLEEGSRIMAVKQS